MGNSFRRTVSCFKNWMGRFPKVLQTVTKADQSSSHITNTTTRTQFTTWVCFCQLIPCQFGHFSQLTQWSYRQVTSGLRKTWTPKGRPGLHSCPSSFNISVFSLLLSEPGRQLKTREIKKPNAPQRGFPHFSLLQAQSPPTHSCQGSFHLLS